MDTGWREIEINAASARTPPLPAATVNAGLTVLYWRIGMRINKEIFKRKRAAYGKQILATLSQELTWTHFIALIPLKENYEELGI